MVQMRLTTVAAIVAGSMLCLPAAMAQQPQSKEVAQKSGGLSDQSVNTLMTYAWTVLPTKFTSPEGKTILVDKSKTDAHISLEVGREVIKAGYRSAQAHLCEMWDEQVANYDALMAREKEQKRNDQQLLFITTLHRMTIHMVAGKMKVVDKGNDEVQIQLEPIEPSKDSCPDEKKKNIREAVIAYVKESPLNVIHGNPPPATADAAAGPAPAAATQPVADKKAADKKK